MILIMFVLILQIKSAIAVNAGLYLNTDSARLPADDFKVKCVFIERCSVNNSPLCGIGSRVVFGS